MCFQSVLTSLCSFLLQLLPQSPLAAVLCASLTAVILTLGYLVLLRLGLWNCLSTSEDPSDSTNRILAWKTGHRWFATSGLLVVGLSLINLPSMPMSGLAKGLAYAQLVPTLVWAGLCARSQSQYDHHQLSDSSRRLYSLLYDLVFWGQAFGLLVYAVCMSNLLHLLNLAHPSLSPEAFQHGLRAGMLLGLWRNPNTSGIRSLMSVAFVVDWLGDKVMVFYLVPLLQFFLVLLAWLPLKSKLSGWEGLVRAGIGLSFGRILGRALGALLLGEEGPTLLEPIAEIVVTIWMLPELTANFEEQPVS